MVSFADEVVFLSRNVLQATVVLDDLGKDSNRACLKVALVKMDWMCFDLGEQHLGFEFKSECEFLFFGV